MLSHRIYRRRRMKVGTEEGGGMRDAEAQIAVMGMFPNGRETERETQKKEKKFTFFFLPSLFSPSSSTTGYSNDS